ncbi:7538_t:CDS:2, partial [Racocetra fulgida]
QKKIITFQNTKSLLNIKDKQRLIQELFTSESSREEVKLQLCNKAFNTKDGTNRANQEEILYWPIYKKNFRVQFNEFIKNSGDKISKKKEYDYR